MKCKCGHAKSSHVGQSDNDKCCACWKSRETGDTMMCECEKFEADSHKTSQSYVIGETPIKTGLNTFQSLIAELNHLLIKILDKGLENPEDRLLYEVSLAQYNAYKKAQKLVEDAIKRCEGMVHGSGDKWIDISDLKKELFG